jgi:arylsulfatase A-like enzyme
MKKISYLVLFLGGFVFAGMLTAQSARPNILYFYVDDMGWGALGPNAQFERKAKGLPHLITPTLDRLAAEGVNFRRSYGCTVCSPARSSQQTGFHQGHTFADQNDPDNARKAIRSDDKTMGDVLSQAGYVTGYWGKWGYGGSQDRANPEILNVQTLPTSHGYQHVLAELHHVRAHTFYQPTLWKAPASPGVLGGLELVPNSMARFVGNKSYPTMPSLHDHPDYPKTAYCDDSYAFAALDFVRVQAQNYNTTGQPFFGLLAVQVPHSPFKEISQLPEWEKVYQGLPFWESLSDDSKYWASMISRIDGHLGNILAALEDPNGDGDQADSVLEDTLVVFQSDNGGHRNKAYEEFDSVGGLRDAKGSIEEGGIRVPMMIRLPANFASKSPLKAGTSTNLVFDVTDFLPTFCDLAGVVPPLGIDGVSLAPTLMGTGHQKVREFVIHEAGDGQSIIQGDWKLIRRKSGLELYNLKTDHGEAKDLAADHPKLVKSLEALLLGERVSEPKGFTNTYHHWTGSDTALASSAENWSDYVYENAGITYISDAGVPQVAWTATMENTGSKANTAIADKDLAFLALEIKGSGAHQHLILDTEIDLTGRNEIRISDNGSLIVNGGSVSSLRWIEIAAGGKLQGTGILDADVYNSGDVEVTDGIQLKSDFYQHAEGSLQFTLVNKGTQIMKVEGLASLAGKLMVEVPDNFKSKLGSEIVVMEAGSISGRFSNAANEVHTAQGTRFKIHYKESSVVLSVL